ncbi:MAG: ImmA/IrrE family metallo-endopeptidase [Clostridia bacterium]|nr:ImmA/IrrE family metallo-endopeptidase [Clostridia bacterium]
MHETLLIEAEKECIEVVYLPLKGKIKGLYYDKVIGLNKNLETTAEKCCVLAEELGHYYTTAGNILDQSKIENRKQERRARTLAYQKLVPLDKLVEAYKAGIRTKHELAEYLGVTERFLCDAVKYYKEKYGIYCRVGEYWICFDPLGIIENIDNFF